MERIKSDSEIVTNLLSMAFSLPYLMVGVPIVLFKDKLSQIPCPMRDLVGLPCPFCGMTRDGSKILHLEMGDTFASKVGQSVILLMVSMSIVFVVALIRRKQVTHRFSTGYLVLISSGLVVHWAALLASAS